MSRGTTGVLICFFIVVQLPHEHDEYISIALNGFASYVIFLVGDNHRERARGL